YYLGDYHYIKTEILLKVSSQAWFLCGGSALHKSDIAISLKGQFYHDKNIEINWETVRGPKVPAVNYPNLKKSPIFNTSTSNINAKEKYIISLHADAFIELKGKIQINDSHFSASANHLLNVAGHIWQKASKDPNMLQLKAYEVRKDGKSIVGDSVKLESKTDLEQNFSMAGNNLKILVRSYKIKQGQLHFNSMQIECQDSITFEKGAIVVVNEAAALKGRRIWNKTASFQCGTLLQEADLYALNTGHIKAKVGYTIAPLVASFGRISADQYSVSAYASMISGFNSIGTFTDNSIISFSPGLFIQNKLRPPTYTGLALSLVNTGLTIAGLACPAILPITTIVKFSINTAVQAASTYQQVKNVKKYFNKNSKPSSANTVQMVTAISQCLMATSYAVNGAVMNANGLSLNTPTFDPPPVGALIQSSAANMLSMFSGYNNYSVININPGVIIGAGSANYSLFNMNAGGLLGLSSVNNSLYNLDAGFSATLGSNLNTGYAAYVAGNQYSLLGQNVYNYNKLTLDPVASLPYSNWSVVTDDLSIKRSAILVDSNVKASHIHEHHALTLHSSHLSGDQLALHHHEALHLDNSSLHLNRLTISEQSTATLQHSQANIGALTNSGDLLSLSSATNINQLNNQHHAQWVDSQASIHETKNSDHGILAVDGSAMNTGLIHNAPTADLALRSSQLEGKEIQNEGQLHIDDSFAHITTISNTGSMQADNALLHYQFLSSNPADLHFTQTKTYNSASGPSLSEIQTFLENTPRLFYDVSGIYYKADHDLTLNQRTINSLLPVSYIAPNLTAQGNWSTNTDLSFYTNSNLLIDHANIHSASNLTAIAGDTLTLTDASISASQDLSLSSHDALTSTHSSLHGQEISLHAQNGNIDLAATQINAQNYVEVVANHGNVNIEYTAQPIQGQYDSQYQWDPSIIVSGQGLNHHNIGIAIVAGQDITVKGSTLLAQGDNYINARGSTHFTPAYHQYIANVETKHSALGFSSRQVVTSDYQLLQSRLISLNGKNQIVGQDIESTATHFLSKNGTDLYADKEVKLFDVTASRETKTNHTSFWGASSSSKHEMMQESIPTIIANSNPGSTRIHAGESITSHGTFFNVVGSIDISSNNVELLAAKTTQTISMASHKIGVSAFNIPLIGSDHPITLPSTDPTYASLEMLLNSSDATETVVNSASTMASMVSSYADIQQAFNSQQFFTALSDRYGLLVLTEPNITLTWSQSSAKYSYQMASGAIHADQLSIHADEKITLETPTLISGDMHLIAKEANLVAPRLESVTHSSSTHLAISSDADGNLSGSFSKQKSDTYIETSAALPIQVGGTLHIETEKLNIHAQVEANNLSGCVSELNIFTPADTATSRSSSTSLSSRGHVNFESKSTNDSSYHNGSYIQIHQGLSQAFKADSINLQNAHMTGENTLANDIVHHQTLDPKHSKEHHGMVINTQDINKTFNYFKPAEQHINQDVMQILEVKSMNEAQSKINSAYCLSKDIYDPNINTTADCSFAAKDAYYDSHTGMKVRVYENAANHEAIIAFQGTKELRNLISSADIAKGSIPQDTQTAEFNAFMTGQIAAYQARGYEVTLTG
ncbi:MAG TPA: hypothetical protein VHA13_05650, partial [Gammaproteobacteria bacterium]|nr:hypothetical protein [Gammaproteobacteria bacterium]